MVLGLLSLHPNHAIETCTSHRQKADTMKVRQAQVTKSNAFHLKKGIIIKEKYKKQNEKKITGPPKSKLYQFTNVCTLLFPSLVPVVLRKAEVLAALGNCFQQLGPEHIITVVLWKIKLCSFMLV